MPTPLQHPAPHHDGSALLVPEPVVAAGSPLTVFVRVPSKAGVRQVHVRTVNDGEPVFVEGHRDRVTGGWTWYRFTWTPTSGTAHNLFLFHAADREFWLNAAGVFRWEVPDHSDFVLTDAAPAPAWADDAICYEIFPDRFARSGRIDAPLPAGSIESAWQDPVIARDARSQVQFYRGDLYGIGDRLDRVASLGAVDADPLTDSPALRLGGEPTDPGYHVWRLR